MPLIDMKALKAQVSVLAVLRLINWKPFRTEQTAYRGPCPIHHSSRPQSRSFAATATGFCCHSCGERGDSLRLWMLLTGLKLYPAALDLCERLHIDPPFLAPVE